MTSAQVVETSVTNNSSSQDYPQPDDHTIRTTDTTGFKPFTIYLFVLIINHKTNNFLDCDWLKKLLYSTNSLAKLFSDSLLLDSLLSDSAISQSHSKLYFKSTNDIQSCSLNQPITFKVAV